MKSKKQKNSTNQCRNYFLASYEVPSQKHFFGLTLAYTGCKSEFCRLCRYYNLQNSLLQPVVILDISLYVATREEILISCQFDQETLRQIFFYTGTYSSTLGWYSRMNTNYMYLELHSRHKKFQEG